MLGRSHGPGNSSASSHGHMPVAPPVVAGCGAWWSGVGWVAEPVAGCALVAEVGGAEPVAVVPVAVRADP